MSAATDHNYYSTFISVAEDCPVSHAEEPKQSPARQTAANVHFGLTFDDGGRFTQAQILFRTYLNAKGLDPAANPEDGPVWHDFYSKGQPCLRTSALAKRYGWGFHFDAKGLVTAVPVGSDAYENFADDAQLQQLKAMRSTRASK